MSPKPRPSARVLPLRPADAGKDDKGEGESSPQTRSPYATKAYVILQKVTPSSRNAPNRVIVDVKLNARSAREVMEQNPGSYIVRKDATK